MIWSWKAFERRASPRRARRCARILAALAAPLLAAPLAAGGNPSTQHFKPAASGDGTANGDYVSSAAALDTFYRYFIEVPPGTSRLVVDLWDPDVNSGGATEQSADRDSNEAASAARYTLLNPSGAQVVSRFNQGTTLLPVAGDDAWINLYDSDAVETLASAPAFGSASSANQASGATLTVPLPAGTSAGDLLLLYLAQSETTTTIGLQTGWTRILEGNLAGSGDITMSIYFRVATGTDPNVFSMASTTQEAVGVIARYTGVSAIELLHASAGAEGNSTGATVNAPAVTTLVANTRVVRGASISGHNRAFTAPGGTTQRAAAIQTEGGNGGVELRVADAIQAAAGSTGIGSFSINATESWEAFTVALRGGGATAQVAPEAGHWELRMDMSSAITGGGVENAHAVRAHDGDSGAGGTELNVYYDSHVEFGILTQATATTRAYQVYPYLTSGCTAFENDFDYDVGNGTGLGTAPYQFGGIQLWTRSNNASALPADRLQDIQSASLTVNNAWGRNAITPWTTDFLATEYGVWRADVQISRRSTGGNLSHVWFSDFESAAATPAANPTANAYRVFLPRDGGGAPVKPYLEQVAGHLSGPNPPVSGQTSVVTVTVRLVNPTPHAITFSGSTTADDVVVASLPGDARVAYAGASAQASCGSVASQPANLATSGNVIWSPGTVAGGASCLLAYDVHVTPTGANQRIPLTPAPNIDANFASAAGTRARFVDETGNTTQARARFVFGPLCELAVTSNELTRVLVSDFSARPARAGLALEWRTATEEGTSAFYLYRRAPGERSWREVGAGALASHPFAPAGTTYRLSDPGGRIGALYTLVEVEAGGAVRSYGPFEARPAADEAADEAGFEAVEAPFGYERRIEGPDPVALARLQRARENREGAPGPVGPGNALKARIDKPGLYRLTSAELAAGLGVPEAVVRARLAAGGVRLEHRGAQVGWFAAADRSALYFVGEGPADELEAEAVYRAALAPGAPMASVLVAPSAPQPTSSSRERVESESDLLPYLVQPLDPASDFWFWDFLFATPSTPAERDYTLAAPDPELPAAPAVLEVRLFGASATGVENEHRAEIELAGVPVGTAVWTGAVAHVERIEIDPSLLAGTPVVTVRALAAPGVPFNSLLVDGFAVEYRRRHRASGDALSFGAVRRASVEGFGAPEILLLDVSDPARPVRLIGAAVTPDGTDGWRLGFRAAEMPRRYLASTLAAALTPRALERDRPSRLRASAGAEYVVIAPEALIESAEALAARRAAQGLSVLVARLEDVEDEFDDGIRGPRALGRFLAWAGSSWQVQARYALLLGAGSYDLRDRLGLGGNLVPVRLDATASGLVATDAAWGDLDDDGAPEIAVGRLPALSNAEVEAFLAKLDRVEQAVAEEPGPTHVTLAADDGAPGGDYQLDAARFASRLAAGVETELVSVGQLGGVAAHARLLEELAAGTDLVAYFGHGGLTQLTDNGLLRLADVPTLPQAGRTPWLAAMTCSINRTELAGYRALGAELVLADSRGAVATWAPAGQSPSGEARALAQALADLAYRAQETRLGDLLTGAARRYLDSGGDPELPTLYVLLGDPATRLATRLPISPPGPPGPPGTEN